MAPVRLYHYLCGMKKSLLLLGVFLVLLVTGLFIYLSTAKGYFDVKLPVLSHVQDFQFTDQNGQEVNNHTVDGKIYVTEYFFTTCTGICPKMNANMVEVYKKYKDSSDFAIISHTSMPETDSVPLLKDYEEKMIGKAPNNRARWYFVTGQKDSLYKMARQSYMLDDHNNNSENIDDNFIHTQFFALVDKQKRVRGIYDGLKKDEIVMLENDISKLMHEKN